MNATTFMGIITAFALLCCDILFTTAIYQNHKGISIGMLQFSNGNFTPWLHKLTDSIPKQIKINF